MALIIELKVAPGSGRMQWSLDKKGGLKCHIKAPAEQGKANKDLVKFLAKSLGIPQEKVTIVSGQTSRNKRIKIDLVITFEQLLGLLGIERQQSLFKE